MVDGSSLQRAEVLEALWWFVSITDCFSLEMSAEDNRSLLLGSDRQEQLQSCVASCPKTLVRVDVNYASTATSLI